MGITYDDAMFQQVHRHYFVEPGDPTGTTSLIARWYPKGPIDIKKFGLEVTTEYAASKNDVSLTCDSDASVMATVHCSSTQAVGIASKAVDAANQRVDAGSYISITAGATVGTGDVQPFVDYVKAFSVKHVF